MSDKPLSRGKSPARQQGEGSKSPRQPVGVGEAPPVPRRLDSLPAQKSAEGYISKPAMELSPYHVSQQGTQPTNVTMSRMESSSSDGSSASLTFEARSLWRESFRTLFEFYRSQVLCDVELVVGKKKIKCHRVVLACISHYFQSMFTSDMAETKQEKVTIKDIDETALEQLVDFAYTAKITLTTDNVQTLLYAASILQVESVVVACCDFLKAHLHPSNSLGIYAFAEQHGHLELMDKSNAYVLDHFAEVAESDEFLTMSAKHLGAVLDSPQLNVANERVVYEAVMLWVKHDPMHRKKHLSILIAKVKLPLIPVSFLIDEIAQEDLLKTDMRCRDLLDEAKNHQLSMAQVLPSYDMSERSRPRKSYAGVIFCVGGRGAAGDPFKSIECYDLRHNHWFFVAEMSTRRRHVGVVSVGGKVYAIGGHDGSEHLNTGEVFDPSTNKWKPITPMATHRRGIALACLGGPIYAVGGLDDSTCYNIVERYDPDSDTWSFVHAMFMPRGGVAVAALKGYLYAIGGNDGAASLESCERYDPHLGKWSMITPMHKRRAGAGVAEMNGFLYVVGGFDDNSPLDSVERYDPNTDSWSLQAKMSCPRGGVGLAALAGKLYAVGGHDGSSYLNSVEAYDPVNKTWENASGIGVCRAGAGIIVVYCRVDELRDITKVSMAPAAGPL